MFTKRLVLKILLFCAHIFHMCEEQFLASYLIGFETYYSIFMTG